MRGWYRKGEQTQTEDDRAYYRRIGEQGITVSLRAIVDIVVELKNQGYSEPALLAVQDESLDVVR